MSYFIDGFEKKAKSRLAKEIDLLQKLNPKSRIDFKDGKLSLTALAQKPRTSATQRIDKSFKPPTTTEIRNSLQSKTLQKKIESKRDSYTVSMSPRSGEIYPGKTTHLPEWGLYKVEGIQKKPIYADSKRFNSLTSLPNWARNY